MTVFFGVHNTVKRRADRYSRDGNVIHYRASSAHIYFAQYCHTYAQNADSDLTDGSLVYSLHIYIICTFGKFIVVMPSKLGYFLTRYLIAFVIVLIVGVSFYLDKSNFMPFHFF